MKKKRLKKSFKVLLVVLIILVLIVIIGSIILSYTGNPFNLKLKLLTKKTITVEVFSDYSAKLPVKATYKGKDISNNVKEKSTVNIKKLGTYQETYTIKYKMLSKSLTRVIKVVDHKAPIINLVSDPATYYLGQDYVEPGYTVTDNYDKDLQAKVKSTNNIDKSKTGTYEVDYSVSDSSNNKASAKRTITYITDNPNQKIAVLNYHFFYDPNTESCNQDICEKIDDFKALLKYLKDNNYTTLTIKQFKEWMYNEKAIPEKSVLITIDDGGMGTSKINGNKLIPALEEYQEHATLFLVSTWWKKSDYASPYLDVESHSYNMHIGNFCKGVSRGAKMLCLTHDEVLADLKESIKALDGNNTAFCFPFFVYNDTAIQAVKDAGFKLAFIGGGQKVSRNTDKYHITRFEISKNETLEHIKSIIG
jgi:peptidoglycan/xylan/chitin deacetylase (PgdA/CDA1 family)